MALDKTASIVRRDDSKLVGIDSRTQAILAGQQSGVRYHCRWAWEL